MTKEEWLQKVMREMHFLAPEVVAGHVRRWMDDMWDAAVQQEREACARLAERGGDPAGVAAMIRDGFRHEGE